MDYYTQVLGALSHRGPMNQALVNGIGVHEWHTTFDPRYKDERGAQSLATYMARDLRTCGATAAALTFVAPNQLVLMYRAPRSIQERTWQAYV